MLQKWYTLFQYKYLCSNYLTSIATLSPSSNLKKIVKPDNETTKVRKTQNDFHQINLSNFDILHSNKSTERFEFFWSLSVVMNLKFSPCFRLPLVSNEHSYAILPLISSNSNIIQHRQRYDPQPIRQKTTQTIRLDFVVVVVVVVVYFNFSTSDTTIGLGYSNPSPALRVSWSERKPNQSSRRGPHKVQH